MDDQNTEYVRNLIGKSVGNVENNNNRETQLLDDFNASQIDFASSQDGSIEERIGFKKIGLGARKKTG